MPTNKQRREASRRHLERQLQRRQEREARQKKVTLITSIVATLVLIGAVVAVVVWLGSGSSKAPAASRPSATTTTAPATSAAASTAATTAPLAAPVACAKPGKGSAPVSFKGVTVKNPTDLAHAPQVTSTSTVTPTALECQDLVVGTGKPATPTSTVSVQYAGVLYDNGTAFDSSWSRGGQPTSFPLTGVVAGFTQGIGGTGKVAPMREGGRRIMILPSQLGYGPQGSGSIPPNAALVFIVDLKTVS